MLAPTCSERNLTEQANKVLYFVGVLPVPLAACACFLAAPRAWAACFFNDAGIASASAQAPARPSSFVVRSLSLMWRLPSFDNKCVIQAGFNSMHFKISLFCALNNFSVDMRSRFSIFCFSSSPRWVGMAVANSVALRER